MRCLLISTALLVVCGLAPALASDHFNLESGIPTTIEDIKPIDRGSFELQGFGTFRRLRGEKNFGNVEPRLAVGILENTQLEIASPLLVGQGAANGNGNVQISILRKLRDATTNQRWPGLALEADLTLPSGIERRGFKNRVDVGFTALLKKDVKHHSFHLNAGLDWSRDESEEESLRRNAWSVAIGHHTALTPSLVLVSDVVWRQTDEKHTTDVWLVETGVRSQLTRKLIGAVGIGAGLNRGADTPGFTVTVGFQIGL